MQVGLHSEPQNIWLDAGTRQPDISSLHHEPVAPLYLRWGNAPEVGGHYECKFRSLLIVEKLSLFFHQCVDKVTCGLQSHVRKYERILKWASQIQTHVCVANN